MLVDLDTGELVRGELFSQGPLSQADLSFIEPLIKHIDRYSDQEILQNFYGFTQDFINNVVVDEEESSELNYRKIGWKSSVTFSYLIEKLSLCDRMKASPRIFQIMALIKYRQPKGKLDEKCAGRLFAELDALVSSDEEGMYLLSLLCNKGGLDSICWGLSSSNKSLVNSCFSLLLKLEGIEYTRILIHSLNYFLVERYNNLKKINEII